jgi:hypothetical protein
MAQAVRAAQTVGWGAGLVAGAGAGIVAALAALGTRLVMRSSLPPAGASAWSAFVAGVLGGLLYAWLSRAVARPALALWILSLALATIDSLLIATLPLPTGSSVPFGIPIVGLVVPVKQVLALAGIAHFGTRYFPASALPADTAVHYVTAAVVSLLVPRWAGRRA